MDELHRLLAIEDIKQLKAKYFLYMDTKQWEQWSQLFSEDLRVEGTRQGSDVSREAFVDGVRRALDDVETCHHGHAPIIEFADDKTARGLWGMFADIRMPVDHPWAEGFARRIDYGHYEEEYRRDDGRWRISFMRIVHLRVWRENEGPRVEGGLPSTGLGWL